MSGKILEAALYYRELGLGTIPIAAGTKQPPAGFRWAKYQTRLPSFQELERWFAAGDCGIAILCGRVSGGLIVRDFDNTHAFEKFKALYPHIVDQHPIVFTNRGAHIYARSRPTKSATYDDGELRGDRAYVVAPPSVHPSGKPYRWLRPLAAIPFAERSILEGPAAPRLTKRKSTIGKISPIPPSNIPLCATLVAHAIEQTLPDRAGTRHECLLRFARLLRGMLPRESVDAMLPHVRDWHRQALPVIRTKAFEVTWREFAEAFRCVRRPGGGPTWTQALDAAYRVALPEWATAYGPKYAALIRLIIGLDQVHSGNPFPLACRQASKGSAIHYRTAARRLGKLVADGVLALTFNQQQFDKRSSEYQYLRR